MLYTNPFPENKSIKQLVGITSLLSLLFFHFLTDMSTEKSGNNYLLHKCSSQLYLVAYDVGLHFFILASYLSEHKTE